jgi:hypothetical protein
MTSDKALKLGFLLQATDNMSKVLEKAGNNLTGFQQRLAKAGAAAASFGGHFMAMGNQIAGGILNIVKVAGEYADMSVTNATKVGMQAGEWQKLAYAADQAGISQDKLTSGMSKFNDAVQKAATGTGTSFFKNMGIQLKDASGKMRSQQDILKDVADVFARTGNNAAKSLAAKKLFGEGGTELIKMLNSGSNGLEQMGKKAEDMGLANKKNTEASLAFVGALRQLGSALSSLKIGIGGTLAPIFTAFVNALKSAIEWVSRAVQKCPLLTQIIGGLAAGIGALLFAVGAAQVAFGAFATVVAKCTKIVRMAQSAMLFFKAVINGTKGATYAALLTQRQFTIATKLHAACQGIATTAQLWWNVAMKASTVALNKLWYGIIVATAKNIALAVSTAAVTTAQWLWNGAVVAGRAVLAFFTSGIILTGIKLGALAVWQGISTAAQWLFNASLYGCPIVWIIAGIMAVIAAVVLMVVYWKDIVAFFRGLWNSIINIFVAAWERIKNLFLRYHPVGILISNWSKVRDWFVGLWDGIRNVFVNAWDGIIEWFSGLPAMFADIGQNIIQGLINGITGALGWLWDTITGIARHIGGFFAKILGINSPSTMFAKFGLNITQGLTVGIGRGEDEVGHATGSMAEEAVNGYEQSLQAQTVPAMAIAGGGMAGGNSGMGGAFNYSPTINIGAGVTEGDKQDFASLLRAHYREIVDIMQRSAENKARLSYNT